MGGEVGLQSRPGEGSLFWFTARLPAAIVPGGAADTTPAEDGAPAEEQLRTTFASRRVLVVDDNEVNRIVARAQLNAVGLEPDDAADGEQALALADSGAYDIILMDVHMPGLGGIEATRRIRRIERYSDTPIVALTADAFSDDRQRLLDAGMSDHLAAAAGAPVYIALAHWLAKSAAAQPRDEARPLRARAALALLWLATGAGAQGRPRRWAARRRPCRSLRSRRARSCATHATAASLWRVERDGRTSYLYPGPCTSRAATGCSPGRGSRRRSRPATSSRSSSTFSIRTSSAVSPPRWRPPRTRLAAAGAGAAAARAVRRGLPATRGHGRADA